MQPLWLLPGIESNNGQVGVSWLRRFRSNYNSSTTISKESKAAYLSPCLDDPLPRDIIAVPAWEELLSDHRVPGAALTKAAAVCGRDSGGILAVMKSSLGTWTSTEVSVDYPRLDWRFPSIWEVLLSRQLWLWSCCLIGSCLTFSFQVFPEQRECSPKALHLCLPLSMSSLLSLPAFSVSVLMLRSIGSWFFFKVRSKDLFLFFYIWTQDLLSNWLGPFSTK